ncbi:hypothetical protein [Bacillus sp. FJAT-27245]|uniref:hypothetical protein n=1 Tax=Bacillus sp. FJAT-27245 TaxID=1684144 RepID=UPI0006A798F1|nr:hypothetical protein [Bacillus sp. FJAT-27245]
MLIRLVKLIYDADSKVILGGQVVGKKGAVLRVDVLATAIYNKMTKNKQPQAPVFMHRVRLWFIFFEQTFLK